MEPISLIDGAEFLLPPDFLTDDDFLVEKENNGSGIVESRHGFGSYEVTSGFGSTVKPKQMVQPNDFSGGFCGNHPCQTAWDLYCTNERNHHNNQSSRGLLELPRKYTFAAAKIPNNGSGFYNHQSLTYQKLQAIQFQQLKQQQWMKQHRQLVQQSSGVRFNNNKTGGSVDLSSSAWLPSRAVFLGDHTGKRSSTGTGVFLPRTATAETHKIPKDVPWKQRSNNGGVKAEKAVNELQLPSDWAY